MNLTLTTHDLAHIRTALRIAAETYERDAKRIAARIVSPAHRALVPVFREQAKEARALARNLEEE